MLPDVIPVPCLRRPPAWAVFLPGPSFCLGRPPAWAVLLPGPSCCLGRLSAWAGRRRGPIPAAAGVAVPSGTPPRALPYARPGIPAAPGCAGGRASQVRPPRNDHGGRRPAAEQACEQGRSGELHGAGIAEGTAVTNGCRPPSTRPPADGLQAHLLQTHRQSETVMTCALPERVRAGPAVSAR
jgi:hypothetical protein